MKKIVFLFTAAFILILLIAGIAYFFRVDAVEVKSGSCKNVAYNKSLNGKFIFLVNKEELEKDIKENSPCVKSIKLTKNYPSKITIEVQTFGAVAKIAETNFASTQTGEVLGSYKEDNLPTIFAPGLTAVDQNTGITDAKALFALEVAALIQKSDFQPLTIRVVSKEEIAVYGSNERVAIFTTNRSASSQVDSLQQVTAIAKIDHGKIARIDLRFDKPVITYK